MIKTTHMTKASTPIRTISTGKENIRRRHSYQDGTKFYEWESEPFGLTALAWGGIHYGDKLFISTNGETAQYLTGEYTRSGTISQAQISH